MKLLVDIFNPSKISSINTNFLHPYLSKRVGSGYFFGEKLKPILKPNLNNYYFSIIDGIITTLSTYNPSLLTADISSFIGAPCCYCKKPISPTESKYTCAKTKKSIHKECAKSIEGYYYSPDVVKTCSKCKKQSISWVNNGAILCGKCLDE